MTKIAFEKIKNLLHDSMGLDASTVGDSSIERAINHRMDVLGLSGASSYLPQLKKNSAELNELVEEVVVPETWFFRNFMSFEVLAKCLPEFVGAGAGSVEPLRILSVPCSTGEEPYSIAITLMENGPIGLDFKIDAVDISKRALTKARRAIYGKNSFRESGADIYEKYFKRSRSGSHLLPEVREHVNFIQANILKDSICPKPEYYDIIFCRNLLIYFERETQREVLEKLHFMLKPKGVLFIGHAEVTQIFNGLFEKIDTPKAFAFRKIAKTGYLSKPWLKSGIKQANKFDTVLGQLVKVSQRDAELAKRKNIRSARSAVKRREPANNWQTVDGLIESGKLHEASILCESLLKDDPEKADGYYYLGLINKLEGGIRAADFLLKKAIYLDPNHDKALGLSALLAEQRGDEKCAASLRRRESRANKRK